MKAAVYKDSPSGIKVITVAVKPSRTNNTSVLVKVMATGVNPVDAKHVIGDKLPQYSIFDGLAARFVDEYTVGLDFAGVVEDSHSTSVFKKGDHVFGILPPLKGSFTEYVIAPEAGLALKPNGLSFVQAASLPLVGTTCT